MDLVNSKRILRAASYVTTKLTDQEREQLDNRPSHALEKASFVHSLKATERELAQLEHYAEQQRDDRLQESVQNFTRIARELAQSPAGRSNVSLATQVAGVSAKTFEFVSKYLVRERDSSFL